MRYAVYDPKDPRKGRVLLDPELSQIVLAEGNTITKALASVTAQPGYVVWDRQERRVAYRVPTGSDAARTTRGRGASRSRR